MTELVSFSYKVLYCHASFPGMEKCCDVLYHSYVDLASIYQILPQIWLDPDPNRIQIHWYGRIWIHQIHQISGFIQIWIRWTPNIESVPFSYDKTWITKAIVECKTSILLIN